jgi:hypothetical protein
MEKNEKSLWVRLADREPVWLIDGNPHTHQGRMRAVDPDSGDGFLAGSEPAADAMFGVRIFDAEDDDPRWDRWRSALADYRRTGDWPHAPWEYLLPIPRGADIPSHVWTVRGDEVWQWKGDSWVVEKPQPSRLFRVLEGTTCHERNVHSMVVMSTAHLVCEECGLVSQVLPDDMTDEEFERKQFTYEPTLIADE